MKALMTSTPLRSACALALLSLTAIGAHAQLVISDTLTGGSSSYQWQSLNGACLTAGDGSGTIPKCAGLPYYSGKTQVGGVTGRLGSAGDPVGQGALRLTNGDTGKNTNGNDQTGAIYSKFDFPSNQGLEVTFQTATYGGNAYTNHRGQLSGADGIAFFLVNADQVTAVDQNTSIGAFGGSLGYSCANTKGTNNGLLGAYIGLGIDEFGNFSNPGDNTVSGPGQGAGRVTLRGAGNITWDWLNQNYSNYYPSSLSNSDRQAAVGNTCRTGKLWNYTLRDILGRLAPAMTSTNVMTYPYIAHSDLPSGSTLYSQEAVSNPTRGAATPITYGLKITQDGLLSLSYSINGGTTTPVITNQLITASNGPLPSKFRFGFSSGTGGGSNVHEIMCFKAAQINASASSAGINIQQSAKVQVGTQLYLAYYHPTNWWGQMTAQNLVEDATTKTVSINPVANWDASCVLTGGTCTATGSSNTVQASAQRNILTWSGSAGTAFAWDSLTAAQKTALDTSSRLSYLRGDRSNEVTTSGTGTFRVRNSVLGDIVNSSPTWVGAPNLPYKGLWSDALFPTATMPEGGTSYASFASTNATRTNVVYVGANDGLLHGFRAGAYTAGGAFDTTAANDGRELLAYMPNAALTTIRSTTPALDYSSPQYSHNAFVDATPGTGDLYYGGAWHTWIVGGLGAGGNATGVVGDATSIATGTLYALDVTNPGNFSETNASNLVLGEWNSSTLSCTGDTSSSLCKDSLGSVYGTPIIRRLHDGNWAVLFGNGLNSKSGKAGLFIMTVDQTTGAKTFRFLEAGTGSGPRTTGSTITARNGIAYVTSADLDDDHVTDYVYAGDVFGNVWRFDLTSNTASNWAVRAAPIFATGSQPITTRVTVTSSIAASIAPRILVSFGTGQIMPQTLTSSATPATGAQAIYGIWDWDMTAWNAKSGSQYTSLTGTQTVNTSTLQTQTATTLAYNNGNISGVRTVTQNAVCWKGSTTCSGGATNNPHYGWRLVLPGTNEQIVYNPVISDGLFLVNTTLPAVTQTLTCDAQPASGFTMAIAPETGGAPRSSYFGDATNNVITTNGLVVAGIGLSGVGSPSIVSTDTKKYLATQTVSGVGSVTQVNPGANGKGGRLTWIKLR
ncbi:pilus assembly protein [Variovorax sp. UMC13]|uniref:pilus assembly protein n=1 Tax=Variovorax sp. UMC13 TaxID=1862326 RepID=UPI00217FC272|nr:PilC/PilY family type IV pilus protein [Variovorax sp. UMC13]